MVEKTFQRTFAVGIALALLLFSVLDVLAQEEALLYSEDFEAGQLEGWDLVHGWEVVESDSGHSLTGRGHVWASYTESSWSNYRLRFKVKLSRDASLHANFRLTGPNRYFIGLNRESLYLVKQAGPDNFTENLAHAGGLGDGWHIIEITGYGSTITVLVNDQLVMEFTDPEPILSGGIAFESLTESQVLIDDVEIWGATSVPVQIDEAPPFGELSWIRLGGPPGGLGYDIRYKFDEPNTWYVTDANAGVHISTDNGLTWQQSNQGIDTVGGPAGDGVPVFSLTVDPHNPEIIWIGTDKTGDIYRSTDGGHSWVKKTEGVIQEHDILLSFRGFTIDPRTSDIVYAMGELQLPGNNVWGLGVGGVIYKTVNGGESWTRIWDGAIPSSLARYMLIDPRNPDVLYVSTGIFDRGAVGETDVETSPDPFGGLGVLKSTDGGGSWRVLGAENGLDFLYIGSLAMHPENPDELFAAAGHVVSELAHQSFVQQKSSPLGIYRTTDGGESWQQVLKPEGEIFVQTFSSVEICPSQPNIIYAGSDVAIYRSEDGGSNWSLKSGGGQGWGPAGVRAGWPIDMQCDPRNPDRVFANNYSGGNFLSEDGGITWTSASMGYSGAQVIGVAVDPFDPARVFAAGRSGVWYSIDGGLTWNGIHNPGETQALAGGEWGGVAFDPIHQNHIVLGSEGFLEWLSDEKRWVFQGLPPNYGPETSEMEFAPSDPNMVYAVSANHNSMIHAFNYERGKGVVLSRDGGSTWETITGQQFKDAILTDVSVDYKNPNIVYVASQIGLFRSSDSGGNWVELVIRTPGESVRTVAIYPDDSNRLLAGIPGIGLFLSEDGGKTWRQVTAGLEPNGEHRDIIFDPTDASIVYLADITNGVYQSTDMGENWIKLPQGLTNRAVTSLSISSDGQHLYAGTSGSGVFRLDLNGQPPEGSASPPTEPESPPQDGPAPPGESGMPPDEPTEKPASNLPCIGGIAPLALVSLVWISRRKR